MSNVASNVRRRSFLLDRLTAWRGWYRHAKHSRQELCESYPEFSTHITTRQARSSVSTRFSAFRPMSVYSFIWLQRFPDHMSKQKCVMHRTSNQTLTAHQYQCPAAKHLPLRPLQRHPINNAPIDPVPVSIIVPASNKRQVSTVVGHMTGDHFRQLQTQQIANRD